MPNSIKTNNAQWVMNFLRGIESTGKHAPTETMQKVIDEQAELVALLESLTFTAETVAHMRGLEREILPTTDKARELIARVKG